MPDSLTPAERSANMAAIRSSNTAPEQMVRKALFRLGFRYRIAPKKLPGRPDIVLPPPSRRHLHPRLFLAWPLVSQIPPAQIERFLLGRENPQEQGSGHDTLEKLLDAGWRVAIVWECAIKGPKRENRLAGTVVQLADWLGSSTQELEIPSPPIQTNQN